MDLKLQKLPDAPVGEMAVIYDKAFEDFVSKCYANKRPLGAYNLFSQVIYPAMVARQCKEKEFVRRQREYFQKRCDEGYSSIKDRDAWNVISDFCPEDLCFTDEYFSKSLAETLECYRDMFEQDFAIYLWNRLASYMKADSLRDLQCDIVEITPLINRVYLNTFPREKKEETWSF